MQVVKIQCPCCGAILKKKKFSTKYICNYCDNEFDVNDSKPVSNTKNAQQSRTNSNPLYVAIGIVIFIVLIVGIILLSKHEPEETDSGYKAPSNYTYNDETSAPDNTEFYSLPQSKAGKQIASLIFEKPFDEVTEDDLLKVKYLSFDRDFDINSYKDRENIYYSFEDYKDYDNWSDFEDTIQKVTYSEENQESGFSDMDYACFKNLTYLNTYSIDERVLEELKNLTGIHIRGINMDEMKQYFDLSKVDEFEIDYSNDEEASLKEVLHDMKNIRKLVIDCDEIVQIPDCVKDMTLLKAIELNSADNVKDYSFLKKFTNLEELTIEHGKEFKDLSIVKLMPGLKSLRLEATGIRNYEELRGNQSLKKLVIHYNSNVQDIEALSTLTNLEEFETTIYTTDMSPLSALKKMKRLSLSTNGSIPLNFVAGMPELEDLTLICCNTSNDVSYLYGLNKLKKITVSSPDSSLDYNNLMNIPNLEEIYVTGSDSDSVWLKNLLQMKTLKSLTIKNVDLHMDFGLNLSESGLEKLVLDNVTLYQVDLWDKADFSNVTGMLKTATKLKRLELPKVGLEDIKDISGISTLEKLDIQDNYVKDYTALSSLKNLKWIKLGGNISTDITSLKGLAVYSDDGHIHRP